MDSNPVVQSSSAFDRKGLKETIRESINHVKMLYKIDQVPWVIGYSGGKDSTAILQLIWYALQELKAEGACAKKVHVISTDT